MSRAHPFQVQQLIEPQLIQVGNALHEAGVHQLIDQRVRPAPSMPYSARACGTQRLLHARAGSLNSGPGPPPSPRRAPPRCHTPGRCRQCRNALRSAVGPDGTLRTIGHAPLRSTTTVSPDGQVEPARFRPRCAEWRWTAWSRRSPTTRAQPRHRRQHARAPTCTSMFLAARLGLPRRELEGDGPARRAGRPAQPPLLLTESTWPRLRRFHRVASPAADPLAAECEQLVEDRATALHVRIQP